MSMMKRHLDDLVAFAVENIPFNGDKAHDEDIWMNLLTGNEDAAKMLEREMIWNKILKREENK